MGEFSSNDFDSDGEFTSSGVAPLVPISLVASSSIAPYATGGTTPAINTTGSTLFVIAIGYLNGSTPTVTDSQGNTWTTLPSYQAGGGNAREGMCYCVTPTTSAAHTFTVAASYSSFCIAAFALAGTYDTPNQNGAGSAAATTQATGSVTPSTANCLIVSGLELYATSGVPTINNSFTIVQSTVDTGGAQGAFGSALAYKVQTVAAAVNPTWTIPGAERIAASIAVFQHS